MESRETFLALAIVLFAACASACQNVGFVDKAKSAANGDVGVDVFATGATQAANFLTAAATAFNSACDGNSGIARANCYCQSEATGRQFKGTYKAWLSISGSVDAICNIQGNEGTTCTVDNYLGPFMARLQSGNALLATDFAEFSTSGSRAALDATSGSAILWTGTRLDGRASGSDCAGWSATTGNGTAGDKAKAGTGITASQAPVCGSLGSLVCMKFTR